MSEKYKKYQFGFLKISRINQIILLRIIFRDFLVHNLYQKFLSTKFILFICERPSRFMCFFSRVLMF